MRYEQPTLLIIDDDPDSLDRLQQLMRDDFTCYTARTGNSGLQRFQNIQTLKPLVICDVNLPDIVGFDVCKTIKAQSPTTYVMLLTGYNDRELRMVGLNAYADNYVDKALKDDELKLLIRNAYNTMRPHTTITAPNRTPKISPTCRFDHFETRLKNRILAYYKLPLAQRYKKQMTIEGIADHFNLTERTFQRRVEKHIGSSYTIFHAKIRLEKSKELLTSNFTVTQITEILEYSSPSHYSREFKKYTGITPNKYKKNTLLLR